MDTKDFYTEARKGNISGHSIIHKFGRNNAVANGSWGLVALIGGVPSFRSSPTTVRIKAGGNAEDTFDGSGARAIIVQGLDNTLTEASETIVTSGTLASAATINSFWRIYRSYVTDVGVYDGGNIAAITIEDSGGEANMIRIGPDKGQTQYTAYCIPAGKTGYLLSVHLSTGHTTPADFRLMTRDDISNTSPPFSSKRLKNYWDATLGVTEYMPRSPELVLPAGTDIWIEARGSGGIVGVAANFEILLVDDEVLHIRSV